MNGETITLHGVVRRGDVVLDEEIKLPDGTPVLVQVRPEDLPPGLRAQLTGGPPTPDEPDGPAVDQWEREE